MFWSTPNLGLIIFLNTISEDFFVEALIIDSLEDFFSNVSEWVEVAQCAEGDEEVFGIEKKLKNLSVAKSVLNRLQCIDSVLIKKIVAD